MHRELIGTVHNVENNGEYGVAKVFRDESEAEQEIVEFGKPSSKIICCGGYMNAVWTPYH